MPPTPQLQAPGGASVLTRAIETDRLYFELGAKIEPLPGAVLAWMPGLAASPAGTVVHRVESKAIASLGEPWVRQVERVLSELGVGLARIYLDTRSAAVDEIMRGAGFADRDELVFVGSFGEPASGLTLHPVESAGDWAAKLRFHTEVHETPDGHNHRPAEWVALEQRKCADGMDAFLAELDGQIVGAIGAVWGGGLLRMKNIVVHPTFRRRSIGRSMLTQIAAIGRARGISEQCILAVRGDAGEQLYRAAGMQVVGTQVEWSRAI